MQEEQNGRIVLADDAALQPTRDDGHLRAWSRPSLTITHSLCETGQELLDREPGLLYGAR